jgi:hypothetical protein
MKYMNFRLIVVRLQILYHGRANIKWLELEKKFLSCFLQYRLLKLIFFKVFCCIGVYLVFQFFFYIYRQELIFV